MTFSLLFLSSLQPASVPFLSSSFTRRFFASLSFFPLNFETDGRAPSLSPTQLGVSSCYEEVFFPRVIRCPKDAQSMGPNQRKDLTQSVGFLNQHRTTVNYLFGRVYCLMAESVVLMFILSSVCFGLKLPPHLNCYMYQRVQLDHD